MDITLRIPEAALHHLLDTVLIPRMVRVRYVAPTPEAIDDIPQAVARELRRREIASLVRPGERVAIGVGSRGIGGLPEIVSALVRELRAAGCDPFIIPTMGSHGGANAEGQLEVLRHLGVTPERIGAAIRSQMETVIVGTTPGGTPVHVDRLAAEADAIVMVTRVKPHTAFRGPYESGLAKMIAIGLGKQVGAATIHARGFGEMSHMIPQATEVALDRAPIRFGLAILENAHDQPYKIVAAPANRILSDEPALLEEAKSAMPSLPYARFDVLIIDRIGKNISGDGADPNITGRYPTPYASGGPEISKQVVLDLSDASGGNANGIGMADFTTVRFVRKMDLGRTYPNALTSTVPRPVAIPMVLPSDRLAIAAALLTCNAVGREPRLVRIQDTLHLESFSVSASMLGDVESDLHQHVDSAPESLHFDPHGDLVDLKPDAPQPLVAGASNADSW